MLSFCFETDLKDNIASDDLSLCKLNTGLERVREEILEVAIDESQLENLYLEYMVAIPSQKHQKDNI